MIKLINNEFNKLKKSRIIFTHILLTISLIVMNKYSDKSIFDLSFYLIPFIGIIICIMYSGTICGEMENGTFRYYLTKPYKRWKIYLSKVLSMIINIILMILVVTIVTCIIESFFDYKYILKYFLYSIPILFIGIYAINLSTYFKSQVFVSCTAILTLCFSLILAQTLFGLNINIVQYSFLPYLDYSIFNDKELLISMNEELGINLSLNRAIVIDFLSIIFFFCQGIVKFVKKDIKSM